MEVGWPAFDVDEVAVDSAFVYTIELSLEGVEVGFAQGPGLREVHLLEIVAYLKEFVVGVLEAVVDFALPRQCLA